MTVAKKNMKRMGPVRRSMVVVTLALAGAGLAWAAAGNEVNSPEEAVERRGDEVVVIYNRASDDSLSVAQHYARRRGIKSGRVLGFDLPKSEHMTRREFREQLQVPLVQALESAGLMQFKPALGAALRRGELETQHELKSSTIRYAVLCYGVPVRILNEDGLREEGLEKVRPEIRPNEAAVDSELALLPLVGTSYPLYGQVANPLYGTTNRAGIHPTNGVLMVARLDGPTPAIAKGLVDKAIQAEEEGLWGRAYFDARGLTNGGYKTGDDWIIAAERVGRALGLETVLDKNPPTFPAGFPMSQICFYAGWYDAEVSGPFARPNVEFMPGAIAYHLHSFSARTVRHPNQHWVGPLLDKGVTATMGCVNEPYLEGTPDIHTFFGRLIYYGFTFGEAAYAGQNVLSWQTTVVGDPLYRPYGRHPQKQHEELVREQSEMVPWSVLRWINLQLANELSDGRVITIMQSMPEVKESSVLLEKLADLYYRNGKLNQAIRTYRSALTKECSPLQRLRLLLSLGRTLSLYDSNEEAYEVYQKLVDQYPDYPKLVEIYKKQLDLAQKLDESAKVAELEGKLEELGRTP